MKQFLARAALGVALLVPIAALADANSSKAVSTAPAGIRDIQLIKMEALDARHVRLTMTNLGNISFQVSHLRITEAVSDHTVVFDGDLECSLAPGQARAHILRLTRDLTAGLVFLEGAPEPNDTPFMAVAIVIPPSASALALPNFGGPPQTLRK